MAIRAPDGANKCSCTEHGVVATHKRARNMNKNYGESDCSDL